jgi:hypothetical protein
MRALPGALAYRSRLPAPLIPGSLVHAAAVNGRYNTSHRHGGLSLHTAADVHHGTAAAVQASRARILVAAYQQHPERFVTRPPTPPALPATAWINPPQKERLGYPVPVDTAQAADRRAYQARPGRAALVAPDLTALRGRTTGKVELPLRMFWYPNHTFDLDRPGMLAWLYRTVLREASRPEDLTTYLQRDTLIALWPGLHLPKGVRRAWEDQHPVLRAAAASVPAA